MFVLGIGKKLTPGPFVVACDIFVYVENLMNSEDADPPTKATAKRATSTSKEIPPQKPDPLGLLMEAYQVAVQEDGWVLLSTMGMVLRQLRSDFDPRTYGFKQLGQLLRALPDSFEFSETGNQIRLIGDSA